VLRSVAKLRGTGAVKFDLSSVIISGLLASPNAPVHIARAITGEGKQKPRPEIMHKAFKK